MKMAKRGQSMEESESRGALLGMSLPRGQQKHMMSHEEPCCCSVVTCCKLLLASAFIVFTIFFMVLMEWPAQTSVPVRQNIILMEPGILRYVHNPLQARLPQCIIIGTRKAGTQALLTFLGLHPDIATASGEVHFFDRDENYQQGYDWYLRQMPLSNISQITIEASPAYFHTRNVPQRIYEMNSSISLLLIVREPTERAVSDYLQLHVKRISRNKTALPFEVLALENVTGEVKRDYMPVDRSLYDKYLESWLKFFSLNQIHFVDGDNLAHNPVEELTAVEKFLGLSHYLTEDLFLFNDTKGFYCMQKSGKEECLNEQKGRAHPNIDPTVLDALHDYYRPHNQRFFETVNKTFRWP